MAEVCSCGNAFDGDNLCMPSACQWEGVERPGPRGISGFASCCINIGKPECRCGDSTPTEREAGDVGEVAARVRALADEWEKCIRDPRRRPGWSGGAILADLRAALDGEA